MVVHGFCIGLILRKLYSREPLLPLKSTFKQFFYDLFVTETWCQKSTEPNICKIMPTPGQDDSTDASPPSIAQQNESRTRHIASCNSEQLACTVAFGYTWQYCRKLKKVETSMGFLRNCISPQPAGKPNTRGNIYYVHWIRRVRSLQFSAV